MEVPEDMPTTVNNRRLSTPTSSSVILNLCIMASLFLLNVCIVIWILVYHPPLRSEDYTRLSKALPTSFKDFRTLFELDRVLVIFEVAEKYKEDHWLYIVIAVSSIYLLYQSFPMFLLWCPGTASVLSILCGALFGFWPSWILMTILSVLGPTLAYMISNYLGKPIVLRFFPEKVPTLAYEVSKHKNDLLSYVIFLRLTPFFPNFFINLASPVLGVPVYHFCLGTLIGLAANTIILVGAGTTIRQLQSLKQGPWVVVFLTLLGFIALIPVYMRRRLNYTPPKID